MQMQLRLEPTEQFFMAGDVMVRLWIGTAIRENGHVEPVAALVTAVAFTGQSHALAEGLVSIPPPTDADAQRWARTVLERGIEE
jgi:hypothetical protein